jgi:hypothetical protein
MNDRLWLVAFGLLLFGVFYAYRITLRPFSAGKTWLSVVVGDAATDLGASLALWLLTGDLRVCLVPWAAHALTGLPMILAQALKDRLQNDGADAATELIAREGREGVGLTNTVRIQNDHQE